MRLLTWISRLFRNAPSAPEPVSQPAPTYPEAETVVLADAHRKDTLRRMRAAIFHDANRNEFGVRLPDGRILYRPTHSEAIALWYGEDAQQRPGMTTVPGQTAGEEKAQQPRRKMRRPVEAVDPESGEVRHRFNCAADAERAGFRLDCIHAARRGKVKTHAGWLWRYAGDPVPPQPLPQSPRKYTHFRNCNQKEHHQTIQSAQASEPDDATGHDP